MSNHDVTLTIAAEKAANHRTAFPNATRALLLTKADFLDVINQEGCLRVAIYFALDDSNEPDERSMIVAGVKADGDLLPVLKIGGWPCPPSCAVNELNPV